MSEFLRKLFSSDLMPHGHCYLWKPEIVWLHAVSDGLITLSYYLIPVALVYLARKRKDLPFHWMFIMFGLFILGCGTTHAMEIWTLWHGTYRLAGVVKALTAVTSVATAAALIPLVPRALLLPSPAQLRAANLKLENEMMERQRFETALREQRNFVTAVFNAVNTMIVVLDLDGNIVQCNNACERSSGRASEQLVGTPVWNLIPTPEERQSLRGLVQRKAADTTPVTLELGWQMPTGESAWISWQTTLLPATTGEIVNIIATGVDVTESRRLEKELLDISAREQSRIGQDLHDGLGQHLTGIAFLAKTLQSDLSESGRPEVQQATKIVAQVNSAIHQTRELARGLLPVRAEEAKGLVNGLQRWLGEVQSMFGVPCHFNSKGRIDIRDETLATQLFRIAQEATTNAIKHGHPHNVYVELSQAGDSVELAIRDDGVGLPASSQSSSGMGLRIMHYRAQMIGGTLQVSPGPASGAVVLCHVNLSPHTQDTGRYRRSQLPVT